MMDLSPIFGAWIWLLVGCSVHRAPASPSPAESVRLARSGESSAKEETGAELAGPEVRPQAAALGLGLTDAINALAEGEASIVPAIAKLNGNYSFLHRDALEVLGVVVVTSVGPIITLDLPLRAAHDVAALPFVIKLEGSRPLYPEVEENVHLPDMQPTPDRWPVVAPRPPAAHSGEVGALFGNAPIVHHV